MLKNCGHFSDMYAGNAHSVNTEMMCLHPYLWTSGGSCLCMAETALQTD